MNHPTDETLTLFFYGEADDALSIKVHLAACAQCSARYAAQESAMRLYSKMTVPEPGPEYEEQVWRRVSTHLPKPRPWLSFYLRRFGWAAMTLLLIPAFWLGSRWRAEPYPTAAPLAESNDRVLIDAVINHLDRVDIFLRIVAGETTEHPDARRERARALLADNRLMRLTAQHRDTQAISSFLDELERLLLEAANGEWHPINSSWQGMYNRQDYLDWVFKIHLLRTKLRASQKGSQIAGPMINT